MICWVRGLWAPRARGGRDRAGVAVTTLFWANSPWKESYADLWHTRLAAIDLSGQCSTSTLGWVNDGLMALFFLVVGLEIKRELVVGELRDPPRRGAAAGRRGRRHGRAGADLPRVVKAGGAGAGRLGHPDGDGHRVRVGVLALLGRRVPPSLVIFLLALAVIDDIGAIVVIAVFYSDDVELAWLGSSAVLCAVYSSRADRRPRAPTSSSAWRPGSRCCRAACTRRSRAWCSAC